MEKIEFDNGLKAYRINGKGVLRFNPADPSLYARFLETSDRLEQLHKQLQQNAQGLTQAALLQQADRQLKELLSWVFGAQNDFDQLLEGVSLLAVAGNGQPVVVNLFAALEPVLERGAEACAQQQVEQAVCKAKRRRQSAC